MNMRALETLTKRRWPPDFLSKLGTSWWVEIIVLSLYLLFRALSQNSKEAETAYPGYVEDP